MAIISQGRLSIYNTSFREQVDEYRLQRCLTTVNISRQIILQHLMWIVEIC